MPVKLETILFFTSHHITSHHIISSQNKRFNRYESSLSSSTTSILAVGTRQLLQHRQQLRLQRRQPITVRAPPTQPTRSGNPRQPSQLLANLLLL